MKKYLAYLKSYIIYLLIFLLPLFFLPATQEFFSTNKLYFLAFGALALFLVSAIELLVNKKFSWQKCSFDSLVILFVMSVIFSILVVSPNKIQAVLNTNYGLVLIASLAVLYFYISRSQLKKQTIMIIFSVSSVFISLITIIFYFQPFKSVNFPVSLQFLKNAGFNTFGNQWDLAIFLGFFVIRGITQMITQKNAEKKHSIFNFSLLTFNLLALCLTLYSLLRPVSTNFNQFQPISTMLPPLNLSWYAAVEMLKQPLTALFGIGVDNFSSIFTQVKDAAYNQSSLWQVNSFTVSRSAILHIFTETGLFGIVAFGLLIFAAFKQLVRAIHESPLQLISFVYLFICLLIFPPSFTIFFLFFVSLGLLAIADGGLDNSFDISNIAPLYLGIPIASIIITAALGFLLTRSYQAEYYFKKSLDGYVANNIKEMYDNQRQAIIINSYIERYRINFAQTNLLIANNIASKAPQSSPNSPQSPQSSQLSEQDRQTISQAIQAAIAEAKAATVLNPQKAGNWENLAVIYRNIINVAQGADTWTISAYQRAIILDPQNPIYRLNLGGVYYSLKDWTNAQNLFSQSVSLKSNWANAFYNFAWASYQKADYQQAVNAMQNAISLLDPKASKTDIERSQKELEEFKKKLPKTEEQSTPSAEIQNPTQLTLPSPKPTLEPKIKLPKEASPEAR